MRASIAILLSALTLAACGADSPLLTKDRQGMLLFEAERFAEAAERFDDPLWRAAALYRAGDFEGAAEIWTGFDTADAAYGHGNALSMLGKYEAAIARYERALALEPGREDAEVNLAIARATAERLRGKGGEGTGGKLGADEIRYDDRPPGSGDEGGEETDEGGPPSEEEIRALWLRRVRTKPSDFLRLRFAYEAAKEAE
ncbi:MAG: hypothetical protein ABFS86_18405 [Planctomycetota bacterium]